MDAETEFDAIRMEQLLRTEGSGLVTPEVFRDDLARARKEAEEHGISGEDRVELYAARILLGVYRNPLVHRYWNADKLDDGTPHGRVQRLLGRMQVMLQEQGDDDAEEALCDLLDMIAAYPAKSREATRLRLAMENELTHGGIRDDIAQCTTTIGAWAGLLKDDAETAENIVNAARRLDDARDHFYDRMRDALDGDQHD